MSVLQDWPKPDRGALFVVSGPSGVGKSTLLTRAFADVPGLCFSVSATTRAPRDGERDGEHYHFLSPAAFAERVEQAAFLEYATVYDHRYGTLKAPVDDALGRGQSVVLDIDVQGARQVRAALPEAIHVFVLPPSRDVLRRRLEERKTESQQTIDRRMELADEQLSGAPDADYAVVNDDVERAVRVFESVLVAELSRVERRRTALRLAQT